jgi:hypothetical protein
MNTNDEHEIAIANVVSELSQNPKLLVEPTDKSGLGYDITVTFPDKKVIYLGVIKMRQDEEKPKKYPFNAVSEKKWNFAVHHSESYYFVIALETNKGRFENTIYSVKEFWHMTTVPSFDLYCYRNRANVHTPLSEIVKVQPIKENRSIKRIRDIIGKLIAFKKSYKA